MLKTGVSFEYVSAQDAISSPGLRMVVVSLVPSPWGEAAKGIFYVHGLPFKAVRLVYDDEALAKWAGELSGPVAIYDNEQPRSGWVEILLLAERLACGDSLIPADAVDRATMFGLAHEMIGQQGLAWSRRLHSIHLGLNDQGGFAPKVAKYLAGKYGYSPQLAARASNRVIELLSMFAARLHAQKQAASDYYIGGQLTAVDIYSACVMALFAPLPEEQCAMRPATRVVFETVDDQTRAALDPILLAHRDMIFERHLELPLKL